jgi:hypothetical protein
LCRSTGSRGSGAQRKQEVLMGRVSEGILGNIGEFFPILFPIRLGMVFALAFGTIFGAVIVL